MIPRVPLRVFRAHVFGCVSQSQRNWKTRVNRCAIGVVLFPLRWPSSLLFLSLINRSSHSQPSSTFPVSAHQIHAPGRRTGAKWRHIRILRAEYCSRTQQNYTSKTVSMTEKKSCHVIKCAVVCRHCYCFAQDAVLINFVACILFIKLKTKRRNVKHITDDIYGAVQTEHKRKHQFSACTWIL